MPPQAWPSHTVEEDSAIRRKDVLTPAPTWTHLEGRILSETAGHKGQTVQGPPSMRYLENSGARQKVERGPPELGKRGWEFLCDGDRVSFWEDGKVLGMMGGWVCGNVNPLKAPQLHS